MAKAHPKLVTPATVKRTVTTSRFANAKLRTGEYITEAEVERQGHAEFERRLNVLQCIN